MLKHKLSAADIQWPCALDEKFKQKLLAIATPVTSLPSAETASSQVYFQGVYYIHTGLSYLAATSLDSIPLNCAVFGAQSWIGAIFIPDYPEFLLHVGEMKSGEILFFPKQKVRALSLETDQTYRWLFHIASFNAYKVLNLYKLPFYKKELRVSYYLLELACQIKHINGALPKLNITQQQLSELCGVSRPSVNQVLKELVQANIIAIGRGDISIKNIHGLREKLSDINLVFHKNIEDFR